MRTCHDISPLNAKAVIALLSTIQRGLRLLRQVLDDILVSTKPSSLGTRHTVINVPWPIKYWVIDKDTPIIVAPTHVRSIGPSIDMNITTTHAEMASRCLGQTN